MVLRDYLRVIKERWLLVAALIVVGLALGVLIGLLRPAQYTATATLYVSAQATGGTLEAFQAAQLSAQRVTSYTELATSPRVTTQALRELGLDETSEQFARRLTATSALNSVLIDISATATSAEQSARIADAVANALTGVVQDLERPASPGAPAPVQVRVVEPAQVPDTPSSPGLTVLAAIGLAVGTALGLAGALIRHALDTSVRSLRALSEAARAPVLGVIEKDPNVEDSALFALSPGYSAQAEAYRQVRTNLQFVDVDRPKKVLLVTSSLSGEGKTTTVLNTALVMAAAGSRVLVIDADLRRPAVGAVLGIEETVGLTTVLSGRINLRSATANWRGMVDVLPSGIRPPNPSELLASQQMRSILEEARARYDYVLVDSPPLVPVTDAAAVSPASDGTILVCRHHTTRTGQVAQAVAALEAVSVLPVGVVMTMAPRQGRPEYRYLDEEFSPRGELAEDASNQEVAKPSPRPRPGQLQQGPDRPPAQSPRR